MIPYFAAIIESEHEAAFWIQYNFFFPVKSLQKGEPDSEYDDEMKMKDERCVRLQTIADEKEASFSYAYDCGNGWRHRVTGEDSRPRIENALVPRCLDGKRACPEEECGGIDGYQHLIEALQGPALRKKPHSRKVDKCGAVLKHVLYASLVSDKGIRCVRSNVNRP
jgi:hypothetical protein